MSAQTWKIPVSPAQRFVLLNLSHAAGQTLSGQQGRTFRRFMRAFGLVALSDAARVSGRVNAELARDEETVALVEVTAENVEYALKVLGGERTPVQEMQVGELADLLEDLKAGKEYSAPELELLDITSENWRPEDAADPVDQVVELIGAFLRARGAPELAAAVERGEWEPQPDAPNGAPKESRPAA